MKNAPNTSAETALKVITKSVNQSVSGVVAQETSTSLTAGFRCTLKLRTRTALAFFCVMATLAGFFNVLLFGVAANA